ncbi:hypothetical protein HN011_008585 [Eciton burchellii]|nr:hypothetical protein HN011_008585 [Eciton burchellii]
MAGLHLIQTYSSSDSDEERDDKDNKEMPNKLALPESILSWQGVSYDEQVMDDPLNHDGRTRSFKHERGNWATLIYINYAVDRHRHLCAWISSTSSKLSIQSGNLVSDLHVSLSRTLILKFHWIHGFTESLKLLCHRFDRFLVRFTDVRVYCNEERTRTFLGIHCRNDDGTLQRFAAALDNLLAEYELPSFYEDNSYHMSFFWCLGDKRAYLRKILPSLNSDLNKFLAENTEHTYVRVDEIQCKIGNKRYVFGLR